MDMSKKAYNSPERKKRRDEGYRIFSDRSLEGWSDIILRKDKIDRTPEQQKNDMFKTMDEASKKNEGKIELFKGVTFEEIQNNIIKKGGAEADRILRMRKQDEERMEEVCDLCGKSHKEHDSRGFIYFVSENNLKAGWSCVEEIVKKNKIER